MKEPGSSYEHEELLVPSTDGEGQEPLANAPVSGAATREDVVVDEAIAFDPERFRRTLFRACALGALERQAALLPPARSGHKPHERPTGTNAKEAENLGNLALVLYARSRGEDVWQHEDVSKPVKDDYFEFWARYEGRGKFARRSARTELGEKLATMLGMSL